VKLYRPALGDRVVINDWSPNKSLVARVGTVREIPGEALKSFCVQLDRVDESEEYDESVDWVYLEQREMSKA
jgi:hypothetical protein